MKILDINTLFGAYPSQHADSTADTLIKTMDAHGVDQAVSLATWGVYYHDATGNDQTLRAFQHFQGRLLAAATLSPHGFFSDDALTALQDKPFSLYRFFPDLQAWPLDYAPFARILELLAVRRKPLMISARRPGDATQIARVTASYPAAVILEGVSRENLAEAIIVTRANARVCVETNRIMLPGGLALLRDQVGIEKLVFGSGAPGYALGSAVTYVAESGLSETDQAALLSGNAERILAGGA